GQPTPSRILLRDASGETVIPDGRYKYQASFVIAGEAVMEVTPGDYSLAVKRGLEYETVETDLDLAAGATTEVELPLIRWVDLNGMGWYGGDLHVHRMVEIIPKLLLAEDLNLCTVQSLWNMESFWKKKKLPEDLIQEADPTHVFHVLSEEDERDGGAVMFYNLKEPIPIAVPSRAYPSSLGFIEQAHEQGAWVEEEKPFWWESPVNVALGGVKSTEIVNNHFYEGGILNNEAWGRPRDPEKYGPEPIGYCQYVLDLYYSFLNAGFPLIPTAGSASGVLPNPLGYNRIYVQCEDFSYDAWWEGLSKGKHFVTNGPALFVEMNGKPHWEKLPGGAEEVRIRVRAMALDGVSRIEVIGDGQVIARHDPLGAPNEAIWEDTLSCSDLSWLAVRVFEPAENTVQFAH
ncbi:MAG: CehA/McbA family metallohydrolase, partial [Candidatus Omnitrophica bacterium]|nr:CehA/McbA family metallohydrolase [Candidatus Omnitrophota bacterium]